MMESLTSSSSKLLAESRSRNTALRFSRAIFSRPEIRFLPPRKLNYVHLSNSVSLKLDRIKSVSPESKEYVGTTEDLIHSTNQPNTIHVKFQLQKKCLFGEQFLLVGDDAIFGLWDPENAIPLEWSDGHIWMAELDIPTGKTIQFKFILKGATGEVVWQPGPDRILQTWETKNTIVISEDWENTDVQKITEEEPMANTNAKVFVEENISPPEEKPMASANKESIVVDNITHPKDETMADSKNAMENITYLTEETRTSANKELIVSEDKTYSEKELLANPEAEAIVGDNILGSNVNVVTEKNPKNEYNLVDYEGEPVLVPGLNPSTTLTTMEPSEAESSAVCDASVEDDEAENLDMHEKPEKQESIGNQHQEGNSVTIFVEGTKEEENVSGLEETHLIKEQEQHDCQTADHNVLENDIQWGRKTLRSLLANLGFL